MRVKMKIYIFLCIPTILIVRTQFITIYEIAVCKGLGFLKKKNNICRFDSKLGEKSPNKYDEINIYEVCDKQAGRPRSLSPV